MKSKEALKTISEIYEFEKSVQSPYNDEIGKSKEYKKEFAILRELVERDTPKKVKVEKVMYIPDFRYIEHRCPICNVYIEYMGDNYCCHCGQKFEW